MQDYRSQRVAVVMIWVALVNTNTHTNTYTQAAFNCWHY